MTGFGLLWGVVVMLFAPRLARSSARSTARADTPVYVMLPMAFIVLGGSIIGHLAGPTPPTFLHLLAQPGYWAQHPAEAADHLDQVTLWIRLDLVRLILQDTLNAALLLAATLHANLNPSRRR